MAAEGKLAYKGEVWGYVYLESDGLNQEDREHLLWNAIDMEKKKDDKRKFRGENYEARLERKDRTCLGHFAGRRFDGIIETNSGKSRLSVLMIKPVRWGDN